jgi:AraC-like DNA-binding protein
MARLRLARPGIREPHFQRAAELVCRRCRFTDRRGDCNIHRSLQSPWSVEQSASLAGMSRSACANWFTSLVGEPPLHYLSRWRMHKAIEMIRENRLTTAEIASLVGFSLRISRHAARHHEPGRPIATPMTRQRSCYLQGWPAAGALARLEWPGGIGSPGGAFPMGLWHKSVCISYETYMPSFRHPRRMQWAAPCRQLLSNRWRKDAGLRTWRLSVGFILRPRNGSPCSRHPDQSTITDHAWEKRYESRSAGVQRSSPPEWARAASV